MTCSYCGTRNSEGDHRCRRCGRRPSDTLTGDTTLHPTHGALAAKPVWAVAASAAPAPAAALRPIPNLSRAVQGSLFPSNVIPFESLAPAAAPRSEKPRLETPRPEKPRQSRASTSQRRAARVSDAQAGLDFLPSEPAKPRTLGTTVDAVIYCDAPVATIPHRAFAAVLDSSMILIGYGVFMLTLYLFGVGIVLTKLNAAVFAGALPLVGFAYGLTFALAGTETPGMHWMHLRLTTFEGFSPEVRQRLLRFAGSCFSLCTVLGVLWSFADEECLAWQDHISRTFPTPEEAESQIFRRR